MDSPLQKHVVIIGAGFAGLSAAAFLGKEGYKVTVLEKNDQPGGRARVWEQDGFKFDMGPSWYWMPDVFEDFFKNFGHSVKDFYHLQRLDPSYRIYFGKDDLINIPADRNTLNDLFDEIEAGSSKKLDKFLKQAEYKYNVGMADYAHRPSKGLKEFFDLKLIKQSQGLHLLTSMRTHIRKFVKHPKLRQLLEFPVLFLGATAKDIPAMYSLMNYADLVLGTWYPQGGMGEIIKAMVAVAEENSVRIIYNAEVKEIVANGGIVSNVITNRGSIAADLVISGADYEHTEQQLLKKKDRRYSPKYWRSRKMSPSCLIFYVGVGKRVDGILHHNLFFDGDHDGHADDIYKAAKWPDEPSFYVCCPSKTDHTVAPPGCTNLFFLMPLAAGIEDTEALRATYFIKMLSRFEALASVSIRDNILVKRSYCVNDFVKDYHAYKGNAYGLANVLSQTAFMKPAIHSKKLRNLLYTGQLTVPGPGVPPAIISGEIAAKEAINYFGNQSK
ncbi:phytoene desaturase family protein [Mucilaginibacter ginkgonis]|uniref:Phytoene desaturase n=1 Tax=Mucilaginibacter ginkgonis TaxID=2682091 RepID=A0A6I4HVA3_9SPHI|nr:phytoene desaturase family protein [Mucilaginibacter ginkgonis]QQL49870.1 phytoene desaturase [Mucilaginibacter ginkgonis]